MRRNWLFYLLMVAMVAAGAYVMGERLLYVALAVLAGMPVASYIMTFILLRVLTVSQRAPEAVVKGNVGMITLRLSNVSPAFFGYISCQFYTDDFAVETEEGVTVWLQDAAATETVGATHEIPFTVKYRGFFNIGLKTIHATDILGLFRLSRRTNKKVPLVALPRVVALGHFPLATHLLTQAHSRFDIKDEDYATISDIRPYLPTDSIKRVHWKLTAKRSEWLVKNFQSNALNKVTMVFDTLQLPLRYKEQIILEDRMIEMSMAIARHCLYQGMPVEFLTGDGHRAECHNPASFEAIYHMGSQLAFTETPALTPLSMLTHSLNDASGYLNMMIFTTRLDSELYERIANGMNNGHYIAVLYFPPIIKDPATESVYRLLNDSGAPVFRIDETTLAEDTTQEDAHV